MKKIYFILAFGLLLVSCKNETKTTDKAASETEKKEGFTATKTVGDAYDTFSGMFLYLENENAAVLKTSNSQMYAVVIDEKMHELNKQCDQFKQNEHDMVPVVIRGTTMPNPVKDGWPEAVEIKEILSVQKPSGNDGTIIITNNQ
ncbi:hypothetical protein C8N46_101627 [Kordia periserrulae]|uniref:NlpE-like protein n=1 Tax=Kordia periserrulae TaxID=701523 RepID=A0A2T6C6V1_9FLAO|nr:hypothetical protein [Kordia periserrulae]PTX64017.1 hypothetical protein C8N46_101627 [Kordia periserrulae]